MFRAFIMLCCIFLFCFILFGMGVALLEEENKQVTCIVEFTSKNEIHTMEGVVE